MKQRLLMVVLVVAMAALCVPPVFAQATGTVKGVCKDAQGTPIVGANLEWLNTDNNSAVKAWSDAENKQTRAYLDELPSRSAIEKQLKQWYAKTSPSYSALVSRPAGCSR